LGIIKKQIHDKHLLVVSILVFVLAICFIYILSPANKPTNNYWLGICVHSLSENEARLVEESGADCIRIDVSPDFENAVKNAKAHGLKILGILGSWMFNKSTEFTLEEWRDNVTYYVSHYAEYVDAWEPWNEVANPDYPLSTEKYLSTENMSQLAEFYFSMVQIASSIVREYDPTAKIVLLGGLNLWSGNDPHLELDMEFARQLADMGIEQYGDAISIHAYSWMEKIEPWIWEKYDQSLAYYRELFTLEFWVTETGHYIDFEGENGQARYISDALSYFDGKVQRFFWYSLKDNAWEDKHFGLIDDDGTPRLAYYELQKTK
jgi:hypothetical protein